MPRPPSSVTTSSTRLAASRLATRTRCRPFPATCAKTPPSSKPRSVSSRMRFLTLHPNTTSMLASSSTTPRRLVADPTQLKLWAPRSKEFRIVSCLPTWMVSDIRETQLPSWEMKLRQDRMALSSMLTRLPFMERRNLSPVSKSLLLRVSRASSQP